jgi:hypothetical protein
MGQFSEYATLPGVAFFKIELPHFPHPLSEVEAHVLVQLTQTFCVTAPAFTKLRQLPNCGCNDFFRVTLG